MGEMPIQKDSKYEQDCDAAGQHPLIPQVVYVQNSVHLAGAQKSLSRLLAAPGLGRFSPRLLTGEEGWLTSHCSAVGIPWHRLQFPSSRSMAGRIWGNRRFAARAARLLDQHLEPERTRIVHANDHPDSLLALELADRIGAAPVLTLRTPGMSERDFEKYRCADHRHLIAVGEELYARVRRWAGAVPVSLVYNGVTPEEIIAPVFPQPETLERIVVLGSMSPRKGWRDLVDALVILEDRLPERELPEFHFLGDCLDMVPEDSLATKRLRRFRIRFLGVVTAYRDRLREYPLAIHPSRDESFGMAALECVAAGVPLLGASTGMIADFIPKEAFRFEPGDVKGLAVRVEGLFSLRPTELVEAFDFGTARQRIDADFSTAGTVAKLAAIYRSLG
jgi:glycosyltransferase involved in cell wall biosynthesis